MKINPRFQKRTISSVSIVIASCLVAFLFSHSPLISIAFSLFIAIFIFIAQQRGDTKRNSEIHGACPELIDILISGVQSGLSLNESLSGLALRGPDIFKSEFQVFTENIYRDGDFNRALTSVKESLAHPNVDQIIEALFIAKELGGAELLTILRLLGKFIREDLALRREIEVKQNWIKNSAHLSAAAPWILLLLLSTQPATSAAFSTPTGIFILCVGLGLTALAYLWMNSLSRIPSPNRIFTSNLDGGRA
ncbi:TadB Flp pilus assembly protein TadB [Candidatus Nanopelagicaceae bacterium]